MDVNPVTIYGLVGFLLPFQVLKGGIGKHGVLSSDKIPSAENGVAALTLRPYITGT